MRKSIENKAVVIGRIYDHNLELKTVQNKDSKKFGEEFIKGTVDIATDEDCLNIVKMEFIFVSPATQKGTPSKTFPILKSIIEENPTVVAKGKENAKIVKVLGALAVSDFVSKTNSEIISARKNTASFILPLASMEAARKEREKEKFNFECDTLLYGARRIEANEERGITEDYVEVKGFIFDYKKAFYPFTFVVRDNDGMGYFEGLELSQKNLMFTKVKGNMNITITRTQVEEAAAFGSPSIKTYEKDSKEWEITWAAANPYDIDDSENGITIDEIKSLQEQRDIYLAEVKRKDEEYKNSTKLTMSANAIAAEGGFNFGNY